MKSWILAAIGAAALALGACGQKSTESHAEPSATESAATEAAAEAAEAAAPAAEATEPEALAALPTDAPACVKEVPAGTICTMDINACGNASVCNCGEGYVYDAASGQCFLDLEGVGAATIVQVEDNACVQGAAASAVCTRDINACGQPSRCSCDDGFVWNAVAGKCLKDLAAAPAE